MSTTFDEGFVVTDVGLALQAKQLAASEPLRFSRAVYGDGTLAEGTDIRTRTAMVNEKLELSIVKSSVVGNGTVDITVFVDNTNVEAPGFALTEVGMFAMDGDTEILYAYAYFGNRHGWIPSATDARKIRNTMHFDIVIGRTTQVEVTLSSDWSAFTTTEDFEAHINDANAHSILPHFGDRIESAGSIQDFWCADGDGKLKAVDLDVAKKAILGDSINIISANLKNDGRINHLERLTGNILLQMQAQNMAPDGYDGALMENFDDCAEIDQTVVNVTSAVDGDDSVNVDNAESLLIGAHYQITDMDHTEEVIIKTINVTADTNRVIFESPLTYQYQDGRTKLYRSSVAIVNGRAYGGGSTRNSAWTVGTAFSGSNEQTDISASVDYSNSGAFVMTGASLENGKIVVGGPAIGIALVATGSRVGSWVQVNENGDVYNG